MSQVLSKKTEDITQTDDFKNAVAASVMEALARMNIANIGRAESDNEFSARNLAAELRKMSAADTGRIDVAPEIMEKRGKAKLKMKELLDEWLARDVVLPRQKKSPPMYIVIEPTYLGNRLYEPGVHKQIGWYGEPNTALLPANDPARQVYDLFKESIGIKDDPIPETKQRVNREGKIEYVRDDQIDTSQYRKTDHNLLIDDTAIDMSTIDLKDLVKPSELVF